MPNPTQMLLAALAREVVQPHPLDRGECAASALNHLDTLLSTGSLQVSAQDWTDWKASPRKARLALRIAQKSESILPQFPREIRAILVVRLVEALSELRDLDIQDLFLTEAVAAIYSGDNLSSEIMLSGTPTTEALEIPLGFDVKVYADVGTAVWLGRETPIKPIKAVCKCNTCNDQEDDELAIESFEDLEALILTIPTPPDDTPVTYEAIKDQVKIQANMDLDRLGFTSRDFTFMVPKAKEFSLIGSNGSKLSVEGTGFGMFRYRVHLGKIKLSIDQ